VVSQPVNAWLQVKFDKLLEIKIDSAREQGYDACCALHLWLFQWETTSAQWTRA